MSKLNLVYYTDESYIVQTGTAIISAIDNNKDMQLDVYLFCEKFDSWSEKAKDIIKNIQKNVDSVNCNIIIKDPQDYIQRCKMYSIPQYKGNYGIFFRLFICEYIEDESSNIVFFEGDTLVVGSLQELAEYKLGDGKCCAACRDTLSNHRMKKILRMDDKYPVYCFATFLINPKKWREQNCSMKISDALNHLLRETGEQMGKAIDCMQVDQGFLSRVLKDDCEILSARYMAMPANKLLTVKQICTLWGMHPEEYYTQEEIDDSNENPIVIHYMHYIVPKPWIHDSLNPWEQKWIDYYSNLEGHDLLSINSWQMSFEEKIKRFLYFYFRNLFCYLGKKRIEKNWENRAVFAENHLLFK